MFASEIKEVKQTAYKKYRLFLITPITDNHRYCVSHSHNNSLCLSPWSIKHNLLE